MKIYKKFIAGFLALNSMMVAYAETVPSGRYNTIYENIIRNIKRDKTSETSYKLIEKLLNQKNKELKDLYLQGDYIVKPEYLEWQIFASGFYTEKDKGDNTEENAERHSDPTYGTTGFYDKDGRYVITGTNKKAYGKEYRDPHAPRSVNLGVSIPIKGLSRGEVHLDLSPSDEVDVNPREYNVTPPSGISVPPINPIEFQPIAPSIPVVYVNPITPVNLSFPGSGNGDDQWITQNGSVAPIAQQHFNGQGTGGFLDAISNSTAATQNFDLGLYNTDAIGVTGTAHNQTPNGIQNFTWTNQTSSHAVMKLVGSHPISIKNMNMNFIGVGNKPSAYLMLFHTDAHNFNTEDSVWILEADTKINMSGQKIILYGVQSHASYNTGSGMRNHGEIVTDANTKATTSQGVDYDNLNPYQRVIFTTIEADSGSPARYMRDFYFINEATGKIELNGTSDILANFVTPGGNTTYGTKFTNNGEIILNGLNSVGVVLSPSVASLGGARITLNNPLKLRGDNSIGLQLTNTTLDMKNSVIKLIIGDAPNAANSTGNASGNSVDKVEGAIGVALDSTTRAVEMDDYDIFLGSYSSGGVGIIVQKGNLTLTNNSKNNKLISEGGEGKILLAADGANSVITIGNNTTMEMKNGLGQVGLFARNGGTINNNSALTVAGNGAVGIILNGTAATNIANTGNLDISGGAYTNSLNNRIGSVGIAAIGSGASFTSTTGNVKINVSEIESTGLFADTGKIELENGDIRTSNGAFNLYSKNATGLIKLKDTILETGQKSLLFYSENNGKFNLDNVTATIKGGTNSGNRGTAFYYSGTGAALDISDLSNYFSTIFSGTAPQLKLNMETGSRLFIVDNVEIDLSTAALSSTIPGGPQITGTDYKTYMMYKSKLNIDQNINLDQFDDAYNELEVATSSITNQGKQISGNGNSLAALAQENGLDTLGTPLARNMVTLINDGGSINLGGINSVAMYASYGEIYNKNGGVINVGNNHSIGIYATNGSKAETDLGTTINIGSNGIGIFAEGYKQGTAQVFGDGKLDIINNGLIKSGAGNNAIGIYMDNNSGVLASDSRLNLGSGKIDVGASENGIGVYINKATLTDSGSEITVGKNGIGIYAKDSDVNLMGMTMNLFGDNALGLYIDGATDFSGSGLINISGKNVVLFNMLSSGVISTNNFTVNSVTPGSSYTLGNLAGSTFEYGGTGHLAAEGTLINGKGSAILLNSASSITANPGETHIAGLIVDGCYSGVTPSGFTAGIEGENKGIIQLGNSSSGIMGKNGARLQNAGIITMGDNSEGMTSSGAGSLLINKNSITVGNRSQGMYLHDGADITNDTSGLITSSGAGAVGIFAENISGTITNNGIIRLSGDKVIGIYATGASHKTIDNNGLIEIGDSVDMNSPSIGIYSETAGDIFTNNGTITSGKNSIGMYNHGDTVTQNGILNIGDTGVGTYISDGHLTNTAAAQFNFTAGNGIGVYAVNTPVFNGAAMNIGNSNYGFILINSVFTNTAPNIALGTDSVFAYSSGGGSITANPGTVVTMNGSDNIGYYTINGGSVVNDGVVTGITGKNNVAIYNTGGSITNNGTVSIGDSEILYKKDYLGNYMYDDNGNKILDAENSKYAVGLYGENSAITNSVTGNINIGEGSIGIATKGGSGTNDGIITGTGENTRGMYTEKGTIINNNIINITGDNTIGMAGNGAGSVVINNGTVTVTGKNVIGLYGNLATTIINSGTVISNGEDAQGIVLSQGSKLDNTVTGTLIINSIKTGNYGTTAGELYETPTIINSGVIKVSEKFETDGINVVIKVDPESVRKPTPEEIAAGGYSPVDSGADYLISNAVSIEAPSFTITDPLQITGNFSEGTNVKKYKLEDIIKSASGHGINEGMVPVVSKSLTWRATPIVNEEGHVDIWMEKINYNEFTGGLWYEDFGAALEDKYYNATGDALIIYDKIDVIEKEPDFRHVMASLAGNVYANINQREEDMARTFENAMDIIINSPNNTKENVKLNIIGGKGKTKDKTDGVTGYDYITTGILALREVERTYRHTFGYSLGYLHTGFEFKDGNESEEWVDTIQLGVHNKYTVNGWKLRNDLTGRVSFHNVDRNIDWPNRPMGTERTEMDGTYETYSFTSDNILGKEFSIGKQVSIMPYGAFRAMYVTRPTFKESGTERLQVEGNDAWSAKPRAGLEVKGEIPLGNKTAWKLKGKLDFAYEYELADINERERAKLIAVEDNYHRLSKPEEEKGTFRTKASIGIEVEERYGLFLTGEYMTGEDDQDDYRAGMTLKVVF